MLRPKIFIGSSIEGLNIAYAVQQNLTHDAEITVWDQGVFELSQTTIESLVTVLEKSDFAIFVFSPDDIIRIRKKQFQTVRDNVVFELGMFIGKLGRNRSFIIMPDKHKFHIPTDLLGITAGKYDISRTDGSYQAATGPVCHQIRQQIKKLGLLQNISNEASSEQENPEQEEKGKSNETDWWNYYSQKKYDKAIELLQKDIESESDNTKKEELVFWKIYFEYKIDPRNGKNSIISKIMNDPDSKSTYADMILILLWEDDTELTEKIINEGLAKFGKDEVLILRKSDYLEKVGRIGEAISLIEETNYGDSENLSIKLAELYENLEVKRHEDAFAIIKNAYIKNSSSKHLTYKLARLAQDVNKPKLALYLFDKLTSSYSSTIEYWGYLGNTCLSLELNNRAMIAYKKADELSSPKQSWILSNIGNLLKNQGFYAEARQYFNQSLAIDPNSEYSFTRVATIIKLEQEETEKYDKFIREGLTLITNP